MSKTAETDKSTEEGFLAGWREATRENGSDPMALARAGGRVSDRLAWVFASGYQAAVRCCFPEFTPPGGGWTAIIRVCPFEVSEAEITSVQLRFRMFGAFKLGSGGWKFEPDFECEAF